MPFRFREKVVTPVVTVTSIDRVGVQEKQNVLQLTAQHCAVPRCPAPIRSVLNIHTTAEVKELPIGVCATHADLAAKGQMDPQTFLTISRLLLGSQTRAGTGAVELIDRSRYLGTIRERLSRDTSVLLAAYVGPLPLHPDWYFRLRDGITGLPNMDEPVQQLILEPKGTKVRIFFRNVQRYIQKLDELVAPSLRAHLRDDILLMIDNVWGDTVEPGAPEICCLDTGTLHIPTIFDDCAITASRKSSDEPITEGLLVTDPVLVRWETTAFNKLFDSAYRGQATEVFQLREFVRQLGS